MPPANRNRNPEAPTASSAPPVTPPPPGAEARPEEAPPADRAKPRPPWRTVAFARHACALFLGGQHVKVLGGEFIEDPDQVAQVRSATELEFIPVDGPEELEQLKAQHARLVARLRKEAAELGLVVYRDGEVEPPRRRG